MKSLLGFLSLITLITFKPIDDGGGIVKPKTPTIFSYVAIGPLNLKEESTKISYKILNDKTLKNISTTFYIINEDYPDGKVFYTGTSLIIDKTISFDYYNQYTAKENQIKITYESNLKSGTITTPVEVSNSSSFRVTDNSQILNVKKPVKYYDKKWQDVYYNYSFENFNEEYIPTYYHNIDFSTFKINTNGVLNISTKDAYFALSNRNGVFDEMPLNKDKLYVPLNVAYDGTISLKEKYYVNPQTLKMSTELKYGYVPTKYIYLPHNEMRYQGEYDAMIVFTGFGLEHYNVTYKFKLNALINVMGDCYNSEYCIVNS